MVGQSLLLRWLINAGALLLVSYLIPGFHVASVYTALITALILGFINAIVRPVLLVLTLPINILTLGLFTFIINALMILLATSIVKGFDVEGFVPALLASLVLWLFSLITNHILFSKSA